MWEIPQGMAPKFEDLERNEENLRLAVRYAFELKDRWVGDKREAVCGEGEALKRAGEASCRELDAPEARGVADRPSWLGNGGV